MRGSFPGFGSVLSAILNSEKGKLVAFDLISQASNVENKLAIDPWQLFDKSFSNPKSTPDSFQENFGEGYAHVWSNMSPERKEFLKLLSRFSISYEQAFRMFDYENRPSEVSDSDILTNPYRIYEEDRESHDPISIVAIDKGMFPNPSIASYHPLPTCCKLTDKIDPRRVRALIVSALETGALHGHTLLPRSLLTEYIKNIPVEADCPINSDVINSIGPKLVNAVNIVKLAEGEIGFQLVRYSETSQIIKNLVNKRLGSNVNRFTGNYNFRQEVDKAFGKLPKGNPER